MKIFKRWFQAIPLAVGSFLSIASVLFMVKFVRGVDLQQIDYMLEYPEDYLIPSLCLSFLLCLIGVPLVYYGLEKLEKNS